MQSGVVPWDFKQALVNPLIKKQTLCKNYLKNYRPISNFFYLFIKKKFFFNIFFILKNHHYIVQLVLGLTLLYCARMMDYNHL